MDSGARNPNIAPLEASGMRAFRKNINRSGQGESVPEKIVSVDPGGESEAAHACTFPPRVLLTD